MRNSFALAALLLLCPPAFAAKDASPSTEAEELKGYYDKAFGYYVAGDYKRAIENWDLVLKLDPKQTTARNMIEEARRKLSGSSVNLRASLTKLLNASRYADALIKVDELLGSDSTNPYYLKLRGRLKTVSEIVPSRPGSSGKAWNAAAEGVAYWLSEKEDLPFAYDALRYASELAPGEKSFARLILALEEEAPQLKLNDSKPANTAILDHKKKVALDQIYDSKFYMAVKELEGVLRLEPNDVTALKRAGSAYLQLKEYRAARRAWQKALQLSPKDEQLPEYLQALDKVAPAGAEPRPKRQPRGKG
ncbi:MAG: tetratricopeptide repeat protein [Elusimicrobiales bacterium]|nr:tetratricopeptide repeat protein [Elusimicrobiales bacterium]